MYEVRIDDDDDDDDVLKARTPMHWAIGFVKVIIRHTLLLVTSGVRFLLHLVQGDKPFPKMVRCWATLPTVCHSAAAYKLI